MSAESPIACDDGQVRCTWCVGDPQYQQYHDDEWGFPVTDDRRLFECLSLEAFQAGLSWITILRKRAHFRHAFAHFDIATVARFTPSRVNRLLQDATIVRHRGKIEATIHNARQAPTIIAEFGSLAAFFRQFQMPLTQPLQGTSAATKVSRRLSDELKRRDWKFVGPTTCYSFMQAVGLVNDHLPTCFVRGKLDQLHRH